MKKDEPKKSEETPKEEQEDVYGEIEQTDPTVLNNEYEFGGGGDVDEDESD
jgi:hypothetical protein